jgi:hypothetical protein
MELSCQVKKHVAGAPVAPDDALGWLRFMRPGTRQTRGCPGPGSSSACSSPPSKTLKSLRRSYPICGYRQSHPSRGQPGGLPQTNSNPSSTSSSDNRPYPMALRPIRDQSGLFQPKHSQKLLRNHCQPPNFHRKIEERGPIADNPNRRISWTRDF